MKHVGIGAKMSLIGLIIVLGLGTLALNSHLTSRRIADMEEFKRERDGQLFLSEELLRTLGRMMLAAMDAIIDRRAGKIAEDQAAILREGLSFFETNLPTLETVADTAGEKAAVSVIKEKLPSLSQELQHRLPELIARGQVREEEIREAFIEIDDRLDDLGLSISEDLRLLLDGVHSRGATDASAGERITLLHQILWTHQELMLATMDSIIDKNEGAIQPARLEKISQSIAYLSDQLDSLASMAVTPAERKAARRIGESFPKLAKGISQDLKTLIESGAKELRSIQAEFDDMDDRLDELGDGMEKRLIEMVASVKAEQVEADRKLAKAISGSAWINWTAFGAALVFVMVVFVLITRSITVPINRVTQEVGSLIANVRDGRFEARGGAERYDGIWRDLVTEINRLIDAFVEPLTVAVERMDRIAEGNIPDKIGDTWHGDFNRLKNSLNGTIDNVGRVLTEVRQLIEGIHDGRLDQRGKPDAFSGDWRRLVEGVNGIVEAFFHPFSMTADVIFKISRGDVPDHLPDEYRGGFPPHPRQPEPTHHGHERYFGFGPATGRRRSHRDHPGAFRKG